jgi:hypothetical protein
VAFFFGVAFFAAVFFGAAFLVALGTAGAVVLVIRPDFVLPRTRDTSSSTAGAGAAVLRGRPAFAFGLAAGAAFLGAAFAVVVFLGAAFLVVVALAFCEPVSYRTITVMWVSHTVVVAFLGAAAFFSVVFSVLGSAFFAVVAGAAAGFDSFLASFTVPEAPKQRISKVTNGKQRMSTMRYQQLAAIELSRRLRTLGAREVTLLLTRGDGAVDMALEGGVGHVADLVVGLDVLLDGLTAVEVWSAKAHGYVMTKATRCIEHQRPYKDRLTLIHCVP